MVGVSRKKFERTSSEVQADAELPAARDPRCDKMQTDGFRFHVSFSIYIRTSIMYLWMSILQPLNAQNAEMTVPCTPKILRDRLTAYPDRHARRPAHAATRSRGSCSFRYVSPGASPC